jgi:chromosome partitioning protein
MKVIAVANQKGGVGKTTITRELSACCALRGYNVLAIDCDSQGSLTKSWLDLEPEWLTLSHVLIEPESQGQRVKPLPLPDAILTSPVDNLDLIASDIRLQRFELQQDYMTPRLRNQIREHCGEYDLVFIDCPPQLGKLLIASFNAADYVLIPCEADVVGLVGLPDLDYTIEQVLQNMNPDFKRLGAVMNKYKPNRNLSFNARNAIGQAFEMVGELFETNIHEYAKITEAPSARLPVVEFAGNHRAAEQFWNFTDEVMDRIKLSRSKISAVK